MRTKDWKKQGLQIFQEGRGIIAIIPTPQKGGVFECSANTDFIFKAVNNFDRMAEALRETHKHLESGYIANDSVRAEGMRAKLEKKIDAILKEIENIS